MSPDAPRAAASPLQWADAACRRRYFYAVWPDAAVGPALAAVAAAEAKRAGGRATRPANLHLTLAFVGEVAGERRAVLADIGAAAASTASACTMTVDRIGSFGDGGIIWLGSDPPPAALAGLAAGLGARLREAGLRVDRRPFRAHITIARRCPRPLRAALPSPLTWRVDELALATSELRPDGPRYAIVGRWPLTAGE